MTSTYQTHLVIFSVFIAIFASMATLRLASRLVNANPEVKGYWIAGGACSMGIGIWAMHFVGMLALHLPIPVAYDPGITAFSLLPAMVASAIALYMIGHPNAGIAARLGASILMGLGIVTMHYSGMAAMQMSPPIAYNRTIVALSVLIAMGASWGALHLFLREQSNPDTSFSRRLINATIMGLAIAGMHYTGMAAAEFSPDSVCTAATTGLSGNTIGFFVGLVAVLILAASLALAVYDEVTGENNFHKALLTALSDAGEGVLLIEKQRVIYANPTMETLTGYSQAEIMTLPEFTTLMNGVGADCITTGASANADAPQVPGRREILLRMRNGEDRPCEVVYTSFRHGETVRHLLVCSDISARKITEEALRARETEARDLALVASRTDNAVIITDAHGVITWVNEGFKRISGYSLEEARGKKPGGLLQGPDTDPLKRLAIRERVANGEGFEAELINYHKSGRTYWIAIDAKPVFDESGKLTKFIAIERDITDRKLAEDALLQSESRLKEAQQLAHIGNWELDLESDEYILSEEALRIHELTSPSGRIARAVVAATVHPDDLIIVRKERVAALATGGNYSISVRLVFAGGRSKHVHFKGLVRTDPSGKPIRIIGTVQDISEQKLAEQALVRLNETLEDRVLERTTELSQQGAFIESILDTAETLIFVLDSAGCLVRFNAACERLTGYRFAELAGKPIWDYLITPERKAVMREKHENQTSPEKIERSMELEWLTRAGRRRLISWNNAVLVDDDGRLLHMIGTGIDITERKRAEQALLEANQNLNNSLATLRTTQTQLVQSEKMASLGGLVAGISHEINTPIGIGVTAATSLQEEFVTLRREFQDGTIKRSSLERFIEHGSDGFLILIRNLMRAGDLVRSFKQVAVDQSSDEWRQLDLHQYIDEVIVSLKPKLKGQNLEVINAGAENMVVYTHPGAIYQVLSNLILNAILHAYEPGEAGLIQITVKSMTGQIQIDFSDDGKGVPASIQERIFDPFFTTRRGSGGSGLGLHIVFNLVVSTLNGSIALLKDVPRGATFRIQFPLVLEKDKL